jgi:iron(III) transport system ATP-binding protein
LASVGSALVSTSHLVVRGVRKSFGSHEVLRGVSMEVPTGQVCALLGPSGSGKTTLLRAIAGLESIDAGVIAVGDRELSGPNGVISPEHRRVGMVFQDWALFPQMTVAENVGFGLPRAERRGERVTEVLDMVGLGQFADRQPGTLSGGQQQRVALARALAPRPEVLLLDEPFSNLDTSLRVQVRTDVHRLLAEAGITAVFVTHDQEEAFVLGDVVAVVNEGVFEQVGSPRDLYRSPASRFVAGFVGEANFVHGVVSDGVADTTIGRIPVGDAADGEAVVLVRPEQLDIETGGDLHVALVEYYGHDSLILVEAGGDLLRCRSVSADVTRGDRVSLRYVGEPTIAYPRL